ncbi:MAG: hypothetical protein JXR60_00500 [Bacteroidales bacterium]|nr:hypothetical protein [Bacteroidales bacterium]
MYLFSDDALEKDDFVKHFVDPEQMTYSVVRKEDIFKTQSGEKNSVFNVNFKS